jgi:hypothetical protein
VATVPKNPKGRPKGSVNRTTRDVREAIASVLKGNTENFATWMSQVANGVKSTYVDSRGKRKEFWLVKPDPAKALDSAMSMAEYHIPKLARTEVVGDGGGPVVIRSTPVDEAL